MLTPPLAPRGWRTQKVLSVHDYYTSLPVIGAFFCTGCVWCVESVRDDGTVTMGPDRVFHSFSRVVHEVQALTRLRINITIKQFLILLAVEIAAGAL